MPSRSKKSISTKNLYLTLAAIALVVLGFAAGSCLQKNKTSMVFVQQAVTGSLRPSGGSGTYVLTMIGIKPHTLLVADQGRRMVGSWTDTDFVMRWKESEKSEDYRPSKAVLLSHDQTDGKEYSIAVELSNPVVNLRGGWISYTAKVIDANRSQLAISADRHMEDFPEILHSPALFIDGK